MRYSDIPSTPWRALFSILQPTNLSLSLCQDPVNLSVPESEMGDKRGLEGLSELHRPRPPPRENWRKGGWDRLFMTSGQIVAEFSGGAHFLD